MGPKFGAQPGNEFGNQLGTMSIIKLSHNWACQVGPIQCHKLLLSGWYTHTHIHTHARTRGPQAALRQIAVCKHDTPKVDIIRAGSRGPRAPRHAIWPGPPILATYTSSQSVKPLHQVIDGFTIPRPTIGFYSHNASI